MTTRPIMRKLDNCGLSPNSLSVTCRAAVHGCFSGFYHICYHPDSKNFTSALNVTLQVDADQRHDCTCLLASTHYHQSPWLQTERHTILQKFPLTWVCLVVSVAQWAQHLRPSCFEMAHHHPPLLHSLSICFYLYPVSLIPCMKLYPSGHLLCSSASANGSYNNFLLISASVSCAVSCSGQAAVELAISIMNAISTWLG